MASSLSESDYLNNLKDLECKRWIASGDYDRQMENDKVLKKFVDVFDKLLASTHWVSPLVEDASKDNLDDWLAAREAVAEMRTRVRKDRLVTAEGFSFSDKIHFARKLAKKIMGDMYYFKIGRDICDWTSSWDIDLVDANTIEEMSQVYAELRQAMELSVELDKTPTD